MKASLVVGVIALMMLASVSAGDGTTPPSDYSYCGEKTTVTFYGGQTIIVGSIVVSSNADTLYIEYMTTGGWVLTEAHASVAYDPADIPQTKKNNPIPGKFDEKVELSSPTTYWIFEIPFSDYDLSCGDTIYIAAHGVVKKRIGCDEWQEETGWGYGTEFGGKQWGWYIEYTIPCCGKMPDFPDRAEVRWKYTATPSYWRLEFRFDDDYDNMAEGYHQAWCAEKDHTMSSSTSTWHWVNLYATYPQTNDVPNFEWDKINWMVNNWAGYSASEKHNAIWYFTESWTTYPNDLAEDADTLGDGYRPPSGGWMAIWVNTPQPTFIVLDP